MPVSGKLSSDTCALIGPCPGRSPLSVRRPAPAAFLSDAESTCRTESPNASAVPLQEPDAARQQHGQRIDGGMLYAGVRPAPRPPVLSGVAAAREKRSEIPDARTGEPGERVARAAGAGGGGSEPEPSVSQ